MRLIRNLILLALLYLLIWCVIGVDEMDTRTYELKNSQDELSVKHNMLTGIVRKLYEK